MSISKTTSLLLAWAALVAAHGYVSSIVVDGTTYGGYLVDTYYYESNPPELIAWSTNATDDGYVAPTAYDNSDIVCHRGSAPGALSAPVTLGGSVKLTWNTWPNDHHGPVITYLANCQGSCADVDKTTLEFFKIDAGGLITDNTVPGTWASDQLIANNYSRTITIPDDIEAGNYVLRHEIIALHGAEDLNGAQNYPQCINLNVTGSGTASPSGTLGEDLYKDTDPGILVDIWDTLNNYTIPGPAMYTAGSTSTATSTAVSTTDTITSAAAIASTSTQTTVSKASATDAFATETSASTETTVAPTSHAQHTGAALGSLPAQKGHIDQGQSGENVSTTSTSSTSTATSGVLSGSCSQEGYWYCNGGTAFQRCVNGEWDDSQSVASGTKCVAGISESLTVSALKKRSENIHLRRQANHCRT
ncbi:endoglucanase-4 precursor [Penicillium sp. IBT 18751x]|nr:endoglucanase-4 precursor [Penicillium sp. IBT 18751x]